MQSFITKPIWFRPQAGLCFISVPSVAMVNSLCVLSDFVVIPFGWGFAALGFSSLIRLQLVLLTIRFALPDFQGQQMLPAEHHPAIIACRLE